MNWSLYNKEEYLEPLVFSNKKSQLDIVREVKEAIDEGHKIIFIKGACGSGKSTIALNLAKEIGRTSIVVPVKNLQKQYQEDYSNKFKIKKDQGDLKITVIDGRNNHKCPYKGVSCDSKDLPCTIEIKKKNIDAIEKYIKENPYVKNKEIDLKDIKRKTIALCCPYWSPIIPKDMEHYIKEAKEVPYKGLKKKEFIHYQRKEGCPYYDQFKSYTNSDVIVFNSKKYEIENTMDRKPNTELEIIDECDEFLDNLSGEKIINLDRLQRTLKSVENKELKEAISDILYEIANLIKNPIKETTLIKNTKAIFLLNLIMRNSSLIEQTEEEISDYLLRVYETAKSFEKFIDETYIISNKNKNEDNIITLVTINLEKKLKEFLDKNKVFVMMSGTIHSDEVLKNIFGLKDYKVIEAETKFKGKIIRKMSGNEKVFNYNFFNSNRELYLKLLAKCIQDAKRPTLVHINSFYDLPSSYELSKYNLPNIKTRDELREEQERYKKGELVQLLKSKQIDILYSTTCTRGIDLPGDQCNSIIFTKYPYPNISSLFWEVLKKSKPDSFNLFYFDKARREFIQRIFRGLRSENDCVEILSPDLRIFNNREI